MLFLLPIACWPKPVSLPAPSSLALKHATAAGIAAADEQRAQANYANYANNFIPSDGRRWPGMVLWVPALLENAALRSSISRASRRCFHFELHDFLKCCAFRQTPGLAQQKRPAKPGHPNTSSPTLNLEVEQRLTRLKDTEAEAQKKSSAVGTG